MKTVLFFISVMALLTLGANAPAQQGAPFKVIVNSSNPVATMPKANLSNLFLKKVSKWENGRKALPVDLSETSPVREAFSKRVHGKNTVAIKSYWQQKIFSGRDTPPPELDSDSAVLAYVQTNADAIGYVSAVAQTAKVKVIEITE